MKTIMVWDLPIRVFHWAFAVCCVGALAIGMLVDDDSAVFPIHMLLGLLACFLLVLRTVIAIFGSPHNRFKAFVFNPLETIRYIGSSLRGTAARYVVHNPGTAAVAIGMFILVPALLWTGLGASGESAEDIHEVLAYALLALVVLHLIGLALHSLRHRENISLTMVTGRKQGPPEQGLNSSHPVSGLLVLALIVLVAGGLFKNYDSGAGSVTIPILGKVIQLGEHEHGHHDGHYDEHDDGHGDSDDDHESDDDDDD